MTTMHCTMEQLLALRGPEAATEPGHAAARDHLAGCVICQQEAARLDQRVARLKALPVLIPARDRYALLEARLVLGDAALFAEFEQRYDREVIHGTASQFVVEKLAERERRVQRAGTSRYVVEPNVKDGKGGLRDLNTLFWIAKYVYRVKDSRDPTDTVIFSEPAELANGIVFLLSNLASGVSGQNLTVDRSLSTKFCGGARRSRQEVARSSSS